MADNTTQEEKKGIKFKKKEMFDALLCESCMKMCTDFCCTGNISKSETIKPNARALVTYLHNKGFKKYDRTGIDALYYCTLCEACEAHCKPEVNAPNLIRKARAQIVELELQPEIIKEFGIRVENTNNTVNEPHNKRFSQLMDLIPEKNSGEIVYFIGCISSYREFEIARATLNILKKGNFDFTVIKDEFCCGSPLIATGNVEIANKMIVHNISKLIETGCKTLITSCSACYGTWKEIYPQYLKENFSFKVVHIIDFILDNINKFTLKAYPKKVTYHDPCHLGRKLKIYNAPREILQKIPDLELVEMTLNKNDASCCGAGGGLRVYKPDKSLEIGKTRLDEAIFTQAEVLVSACPLCKNQFKKVNRENKIIIKDITEIFDEVIN